jgi:hypothetical protein
MWELGIPEPPDKERSYTQDVFLSTALRETVTKHETPTLRQRVYF